MKVLFMDDEPETVESAAMAVSERIQDAIVHSESEFAKLTERISEVVPDVLVVDLVKQESQGRIGEPLGLECLRSIWEESFMPIVIYSGRSELLDDAIWEHPLVAVIGKGPDSDLSVADSICELMPVVDTLNDARKRIESELSVVLRDVAPTVFAALRASNLSASEAIRRACFRRLAAIVDDPKLRYGQCEAWEQYVFPPVSDDLMLGDLLARQDERGDEPNAYRVVLTPSCDLATYGRPKVSDVLVARCRPWQDRLSSLGIGGAKRGDLVRRLTSTLNRGFQDTILPWPGLPGKIPDMVVDLRELELIALSDIGDDRRYHRVASVDSPFRELVSWAYIQVSGRPGLPIRYVQGWASHVADEVAD